MEPDMPIVLILVLPLFVRVITVDCLNHELLSYRENKSDQGHCLSVDLRSPLISKEFSEMYTLKNH